MYYMTWMSQPRGLGIGDFDVTVPRASVYMTLMSVRGLEYMDSVTIARALLYMAMTSADMYSAGAGVYDQGGHLKRERQLYSRICG